MPNITLASLRSALRSLNRVTALRSDSALARIMSTTQLDAFIIEVATDELWRIIESGRLSDDMRATALFIDRSLRERALALQQ